MCVHKPETTHKPWKVAVAVDTAGGQGAGSEKYNLQRGRRRSELATKGIWSTLMSVVSAFGRSVITVAVGSTFSENNGVNEVGWCLSLHLCMCFAFWVYALLFVEAH